MYASGYSLPVPPMVSLFTSRIGWMNSLYNASFPGSAAWPAANLALYFPITLPTQCVVRRMWWANGSSVSASRNIDCGVFADSGYGPGSRLVSTGSTAQGTASEVQFVDVTDTTLAPGLYWIALATSDTAATIFRLTTTSGLDASLRFEESSAFPLPATATPVESATGNSIFLFGFATTASP